MGFLSNERFKLLLVYHHNVLKISKGLSGKKMLGINETICLLDERELQYAKPLVWLLIQHLPDTINYLE